MNTSPATATARVRGRAERADDRRPGRLVWLLEHRAQILVVFAVVAIAAGGLLYLVGEDAAGETGGAWPLRYSPPSWRSTWSVR